MDMNFNSFNNLSNINNNNASGSVHTAYGFTHQQGASKAAAPSKPGIPARSDSVSISLEAASRAELDKAAKSVAAEIRSEFAADSNSHKVAELKQEVSAGTYNVASSNVAGAILARLL